MRFSETILMLCILAGTASGQSLEDLAAYAVSAYGEGASVKELPLALTSVDGAVLSKLNGSTHPWSEVRAWQVERNGTPSGVMMVDNVKGKARPITYLVSFDPTGSILSMEILAYRESHGGEVRSPMFLEQFAGKSRTDALTVGKDIRNISGATISSRALTRGAHALATLAGYLLKGRRP